MIFNLLSHASRQRPVETEGTGERLEMFRVARNGETWLALRGSLPPHRKGPPPHVHYHAAEEFRVIAGTMSAVGDGRHIQVAAGETATFPPGSVHTWWNDGDEMLIAGVGQPAGDLDRHLQATFDVINSGPAERPPLFWHGAGDLAASQDAGRGRDAAPDSGDHDSFDRPGGNPARPVSGD
jgi:mannose-6-phosphate isomerase-like protein (cupin superfamily)